MLVFIIDRFFLVYSIMLFVRVIGSWLPELSQYRWMQFLGFYVDPYLNLFRRIIPPIGMIDISPIIAIFALRYIEMAIQTVVIWLFY
jgi:YggT family protein